MYSHHVKLQNVSCTNTAVDLLYFCKKVFAEFSLINGFTIVFWTRFWERDLTNNFNKDKEAKKEKEKMIQIYAGYGTTHEIHDFPHRQAIANVNRSIW